MVYAILNFTAFVILLCLAVVAIAWTIRFCYIQYASIDTMRRDKELGIQQEELLIAEANRQRREKLKS